jgi:hypothetical protein
MAVLAEAISVVIRAKPLLAAYQDNWDAFKLDVPNATLCADGEIVRLGFMSPDDVEQFVKRLTERGLIHLDHGIARDIVVVDQLQGPTSGCTWLDFGHVNLDADPTKRIAACRLKGSASWKVILPDDWQFENSLSATSGFVPSEQIDKDLTFIRHDAGIDVYRNEVTGREVYVGRTNSEPA